MRMRFLSVFLSVLLLCSLGVSQQRYLVSPNQEVIPLTKQQLAANAMRQRLIKAAAKSNKVSAACSNKFTFGYTEDKFPVSSRFGAYHKDVMGQWYVAKATGTIDTVFWDVQPGYTVGAKDSILLLRIHESNIGPTYGPGVRPGPFDPPCQNWGYWIDLTDADQGVAAFPEDANPPGGPWHSTIAHGTSGPPFGSEKWGLGGYPATDHAGIINHVAMLDNGLPCSVVVGENFFINMRVQSINAHVPNDTRTEWATAGFRVTTSDENYPAR